MGTARRESFPIESMVACKDLARHMWFLLDRARVTPHQLAAERGVPYSPAMLHRFLNGQAMPPPLLIEIVARRCGDREALQLSYDRARRAALAASGRRRGNRVPRHARVSERDRRRAQKLVQEQALEAARPRPRDARPRSRPATVGLGASAFGALLLVGTAAVGGTVGFRGVGDIDGLRGFGGIDALRKPAASQGQVNEPAAGAAQPEEPSTLAAPAAPAPGLGAGPVEAPLPPPSARTPPEEKKSAPAARPRRAPVRDGNLIGNGTFTGSTVRWRSEGEVWLRSDRNKMRISVDADEGGEAWDRRVEQPFAGLTGDHTYTLKFAAAADSDMTIRVTVYRESDPLTPVIDEEVDLGQQMDTYAFSFDSGITTDEPVIGFQLGGHDEEHTVWVDNVSLVD